MWFLYNQHILARAMLARAVLVLGFADQAEIAAQASLAEALAGGSKLTLCIVLCGFAGPIAVMTGDHASAGRAVTLLEDIATTHGFRENNVRLAEPLQAMLLMARGEVGSGVGLLNAEFESDKKQDRKSTYPSVYGALAGGLARLGQISGALAVVDEGLAIGETPGNVGTSPSCFVHGATYCRGRTKQSATRPRKIALQEQPGCPTSTAHCSGNFGSALAWRAYA
jgi:hypothetical protein